MNYDKTRKAKIMLESLDIHAPTNINWNNEDLWIAALIEAMNAVEKEEAKTVEPK